MHNRKAVVAVIIFALIIVGMFLFAYLKRSEIATPTNDQTTVPVSPSTPYDSITRIDAKHFFINGEHTLVGEITMPTPCDLLNWTSRVAESSPEQVMVNFDVVNNAEVCTQVQTQQRFKVTFKAGEDAVIKATLEGRAVELNLIPPAAGETPEDFELFIKG